MSGPGWLPCAVLTTPEASGWGAPAPAQLCLGRGGEPCPPGVISLSSASVPGAVGRKQQAVTLREVGARRRGPVGRNKGPEEGGPGQAAWPDGGRRPGGSPHPELVLGRALGAPEVGCQLARVSEGMSPLLSGLDFLPRGGGQDAAWAAGSQRPLSEFGCAVGWGP